jgi:hypothetical protein
MIFGDYNSILLFQKALLFFYVKLGFSWFMEIAKAIVLFYSRDVVL